MATLLWKTPNDHTTAILAKSNNEILTLRVGDFITFKGRPDGVRIDAFYPKYSDPRGPISLEYLPWRPQEHRWATVVFGVRGNPRRLIAFPVGAPHYGEKVDWDTVEHLNGGICPQFQS